MPLRAGDLACWRPCMLLTFLHVLHALEWSCHSVAVSLLPSRVIHGRTLLMSSVIHAQRCSPSTLIAVGLTHAAERNGGGGFGGF